MVRKEKLSLLRVCATLRGACQFDASYVKVKGKGVIHHHNLVGPT